MKTLVVYDTEGNIIFTQTNAIKNYKIITQDISDDKEITGVDPVNNKLILTDKSIDKSELEKTNEKVEDLQAKLQEAMATIDILVMGGLN